MPYIYWQKLFDEAMKISISQLHLQMQLPLKPPKISDNFMFHGYKFQNIQHIKPAIDKYKPEDFLAIME